MRKINIKKSILSNSQTRVNKLCSGSNVIEHSSLQNKSLYNPQIHDNQHIEVFKKLVLQDLDQLKIKNIQDPIHTVSKKAYVLLRQERI